MTKKYYTSGFGKKNRNYNYQPTNHPTYYVNNDKWNRYNQRPKQTSSLPRITTPYKNQYDPNCGNGRNDIKERPTYYGQRQKWKNKKLLNGSSSMEIKREKYCNKDTWSSLSNTESLFKTTNKPSYSYSDFCGIFDKKIDQLLNNRGSKKSVEQVFSFYNKHLKSLVKHQDYLLDAKAVEEKASWLTKQSLENRRDMDLEEGTKQFAKFRMKLFNIPQDNQEYCDAVVWSLYTFIQNALFKPALECACFLGSKSYLLLALGADVAIYTYRIETLKQAKECLQTGLKAVASDKVLKISSIGTDKTQREKFVKAVISFINEKVRICSKLPPFFMTFLNEASEKAAKEVKFSNWNSVLATDLKGANFQDLISVLTDLLDTIEDKIGPFKEKSYQPDNNYAVSYVIALNIVRTECLMLMGKVYRESNKSEICHDQAKQVYKWLLDYSEGTGLKQEVKRILKYPIANQGAIKPTSPNGVENKSKGNSSNPSYKHPLSADTKIPGGSNYKLFFPTIDKNIAKKNFQRVIAKQGNEKVVIPRLDLGFLSGNKKEKSFQTKQELDNARQTFTLDLQNEFKKSTISSTI